MTLSSFRPLALLLLVLTSGGCTTLVAEDSRACPCASGWTCCDGHCIEGGPDACPAPLPAAPDTTAPEAPRLDPAEPGSPTAQAAVQLSGSAEPYAAVQLFAQPGCAGAAVASATASPTGTFRADVALPANATTPFSAQATDAAGNVSPCSAALALTHDGVAPDAPTLQALAPAPLSRVELRPTLYGSAEPRADVRIYADAACERALGFETQANAEGGFSLQVQVAPDSRQRFFARATDAAGNVSGCSAEGLAFEHDGTAPAEAVLTAHEPASPSSSRELRWSGTAEPGATLTLFGDAGCAQGVLRTRSVDGSGAWSDAFTAAANTTTQVFAQVADAAGNRSACAPLGSHVHDDVAPVAPDAYTLTPRSPSNDPSPRMEGWAEPGSRVRAYDDPLCLAKNLRGEAVTDERTGRFSVPVTVVATANRLYARAVDPAGNVSRCNSYGLEYVYDVTPPALPERLALTQPAPLRAAPTTLAVVGRSEPGSRLEVFSTPGCIAPVLGARTVETDSFNGPGPLPFWVDATAALASPWETVFVHAVDQAGNASGCAAVGSLQQAAEDGRAWGAPEAPPSEVSQLAFDAQGRLYVAGREQRPDGSWAATLRRREPGLPAAPWETLQVLDSGNAYPFPSVALDARGDVLLVLASGAVRVTRYDAATAQWDAPVTLSTAGQSVSGAMYSLDARGRASVCWKESVPFGQPGEGTGSLRCRSAASGEAWGEDVSLSEDTSDSLRALLPDGSGGVRALWNHHVDAVSWTVMARTWAPGTGWGAAEPVSPAIKGGAVAVADPAGAAWLAYTASVPEGGQAVFVRRAAPGSSVWSEPVKLSEGTGQPEILQLTAGVAGELGLGWQERVSFTETKRFLRHYADASGWSELHPLQLPVGRDTYPELYAAGPGRLWLVWFERLSNSSLMADNYDIVVAQRFERGTGLGPRQVVLHDPAHGSTNGTYAAADAQGRLAVETEFYWSGEQHADLYQLRVLQ